jgi:hypothetical protein
MGRDSPRSRLCATNSLGFNFAAALALDGPAFVGVDCERASVAKSAVNKPATIPNWIACFNIV